MEKFLNTFGDDVFSSIANVCLGMKLYFRTNIYRLTKRVHFMYNSPDLSIIPPSMTEQMCYSL